MAHALVRVVAGVLLGASGHDLTVVQRCDACGGSHGRPWIAESPETHVSLSHAPGVVAAVAGRGPVAVDVDGTARRHLDPRILTMVTTPAERRLVANALDPELAFLRHWVRKESLVKLGLLTLDTLTSIDLSDVPIEPRWLGEAERRLTWKDWHLLEWSNPMSRAVGTVIASEPPRWAQLPPPPRAAAGGQLGPLQ